MRPIWFLLSAFPFVTGHSGSDGNLDQVLSEEKKKDKMGALKDCSSPPNLISQFPERGKINVVAVKKLLRVLSFHPSVNDH